MRQCSRHAFDQGKRGESGGGRMRQPGASCGTATPNTQDRGSEGRGWSPAGKSTGCDQRWRTTAWRRGRDGLQQARAQSDPGGRRGKCRGRPGNREDPRRTGMRRLGNCAPKAPQNRGSANTRGLPRPVRCPAPGPSFCKTKPQQGRKEEVWGEGGRCAAMSATAKNSRQIKQQSEVWAPQSSVLPTKEQGGCSLRRIVRRGRG